MNLTASDQTRRPPQHGWAWRRLGGGDDRLVLPGRLGARRLAATPALTTVAVLTGLVAAGIVAWPPGPDALAVGVFAGAALGALTVAGLVAIGLRIWGLMHLGYLLGVVSVPMVGAAVAARVVAGSLAPGWAPAALLLLLPAPLGWYGTHVEPFRLRIDHRTLPIPAARQGHRPVRLGVVTDLQTSRITAYEHGALDQLLDAGPDVVLVAGDLFQGSDDQFADQEEAFRALLGRLRAPGGVYFTRGDTDPDDRADRLLRDTGVVILDDEMVDVAVGDRRLRIGGNRLAYQAEPAARLRRRLEGSLASDPVAEAVPGRPRLPPVRPGDPPAGIGPAAAEPDAEGDDGTIRILVAHRPDAVLDLRPGSRVDLVVAGHTHGGQIVVPGFGPLLTLSGVPRRAGGGGLHQVNGNWLYVSTGVGLERRQAPQVRLFCRPSIGVLDLVESV